MSLVLVAGECANRVEHALIIFAKALSEAESEVFKYLEAFSIGVDELLFLGSVFVGGGGERPVEGGGVFLLSDLDLPVLVVEHLVTLDEVESSCS